MIRQTPKPTHTEKEEKEHHKRAHPPKPPEQYEAALRRICAELGI